MEDRIVESLFGMTPDMYRQNQLAQADAQAARYAQLDPFQKASFALGRGGNMLGGVIGLGLGGQDPGLQRITQQSQLMQGLDLSNPQDLSNAAQRANQMGNVPLAMKLIDMSDAATVRAQQREVQRQTQLAQLIARSAYRPGTAEQTIPERAVVDEAADTSYLEPQRVVPAVAPSYDIRRVAPELQALGAPGFAQLNTALAAQKAMRPETVSIKEGEVLYTVPSEPGGTYQQIATGGEKPRPFTGDLGNAANALYQTDDPAKIFARYGQKGIDAVESKALKMVEAKRPVTNISAPVSVTMQKGFGEDLTENLTANLRAGRVAGSTLGTVQSMKALIEEGLKTGFGAETMVQLGRVGQVFDPNFKVSGVAGAEAFQAYSNSVILPEVKKLGVNPTDTDLKFIVQGSPSLSKSPQGNLILLDTLELKLQREQDLARFSNQWLAQNANTVKANPIIAQTQFNDAFNNYVQTSPLYKPQADILRQRIIQLQSTGGGRTPTPAKNTLQRGNFINP
jgi:hypothetical protein